MLSQRAPWQHPFRRDWFYALGVPFLLLLLPAIAVFWLDLLGALALLGVAFSIGVGLRPKHVWMVWMAGLLAWALGGLSWTLWGESTPAGQEETAFSLVVESFIFTGILIALPVALGRLIVSPPGRIGRAIRDSRIRRAIHDIREW